jgi:hypothetical protein
MPKLCFCIRWISGSRSAYGERNIDALFFLFGWDQYLLNKKCDGTHYAKLVFLHSVGSVGHVMHSSASRE